MSQFLRRVTIEGLHGWLNCDVSFQDGINVFYGRNGSGKTTLLHVIANLLGGDVSRFLSLRFSRIVAEFNDGQTVALEQRSSSEPSKEEKDVTCYLNGMPIGNVESNSIRNAEVHGQIPYHPEMEKRIQEAIALQPTYFPAFRSVLEATPQIDRILDASYSSASLTPEMVRHYRYSRRSYDNKRVTAQTILARDLFGEFIPEITYPFPRDVERMIESEVAEALLKVATANRQLFSRTFVNTLDAVTRGDTDLDEQPDAILADIDSLLKKLDEPTTEAQHTYRELATRVNRLKASFAKESSKAASDILLIYKQALQSRLEAQQQAFDLLQRFLDSVNSFLEGKQLKIRRLPEYSSIPTGARRRPRRFMVELDGGRLQTLDVLSSGERQLLCMIYAATHSAGDQTVVLIDEPELSLHIDWQRRLLTEMQRQMGAKQIIVCTHSPDIGGDHLEAVQELDAQPIVSARQDQTADEHGPNVLDETEFELGLPE